MNIRDWINLIESWTDDHNLLVDLRRTLDIYSKMLGVHAELGWTFHTKPLGIRKYSVAGMTKLPRKSRREAAQLVDQAKEMLQVVERAFERGSRDAAMEMSVTKLKPVMDRLQAFLGPPDMSKTKGPGEWGDDDDDDFPIFNRGKRVPVPIPVRR